VLYDPSAAEGADPALDQLLFARLRDLAPEQRIVMAMDATAAVEAMAMAGLRHDHPQACVEELRWRLAVRRVGRDLLARLCPAQLEHWGL
jgi:hypothetical protein